MKTDHNACTLIDNLYCYPSLALPLLLLLQSANNDGLKVGEVVAAWVWDRVKPGQPIELQKPKQASGSKKSNNKNDKPAVTAAGGPKQPAAGFKKPWVTFNGGRK
jgi:hypothetical protein